MIRRPKDYRFFYTKGEVTPFTKEMTTVAVTNNNRSLLFYDEIKLKLPISLTHKHNLVFTLIQINTEKGKQTPKEQCTILGIGFTTILTNNRIPEKEITITLSKSLRSKYLNTDIETGQQLGNVDHKTTTLKFRLRLVSSINTSDRYLSNFFDACSRTDITTDKLISSMNGLSKIKKPSTMIQFLPVLLNKLLNLMQTRSAIATQILFAIVSFLHSAASITFQVRTLLSSYVYHAYDEPNNTESLHKKKR
eukprot:TRINITY_DN11986_c0_g1_i1.p1 TRINITY_DN11986_c0_g1~~TRINITY_DN11986_c0_g1_i1.p1  ORF type:complete len:250 (-),score=11.62 TRINITY_DN11986_c0_g1_i1:27-776(-)